MQNRGKLQLTLCILEDMMYDVGDITNQREKIRSEFRKTDLLSGKRKKKLESYLIFYKNK